jgi:hypothetical protein
VDPAAPVIIAMKLATVRGTCKKEPSQPMFIARPNFFRRRVFADARALIQNIDSHHASLQGKSGKATSKEVR